jgi:protein-tyrosine phosphatase
MASALLRRRMAEIGLQGQVEVQSAGVWAQEGQEASKQACEVLATQGVDLTGHRSQPVSAALLERADLVLVMEEAHRRSLFYMAPQHLGKVFLLTEMAGGHEDIPDPYGGPRSGYERAADRLDKLIEAGLPAMLKRLKIETADSGPRTNGSDQ